MFGIFEDQLSFFETEACFRGGRDACHSFVAFIALTNIYVSKKYLSSYIIWIQLVHKTKKIHGYKRVDIPDGGKFYIRTHSLKKSSIELQTFLAGIAIDGTKSQTFLATDQANITWKVDSISPHLLHFPSTCISLLGRASPTAKTLFLSFHRNYLSFGEHSTFQT